MGSELEQRGYYVPAAPWWTAWNLKFTPEAVAHIHREYSQAGATIHTTNTFRTKRSDIGPEWEALTRLAYALCRNSIAARHLVAGSISSVRDCYDTADAPPEARFFHRESAALLADLGVDILLCETFASVDEALIAVSECVRTGIPTWVSFTAGPANNLMPAARFAQAAAQAARAGAECVFIGCTPAVAALSYLRVIESLTVRKGVLANAGHAQDGIGWGNATGGPEKYARLARLWAEAGASVIGGCCGIRPAHIRAVATSGPAQGHGDRSSQHTQCGCQRADEAYEHGKTGGDEDRARVN